MIKLDIVRVVSEAADIPQARAEVAVNHILEALKAAIVQGERLELRGFGVFSTRPLKRGVARNPKTGEVIPIPRGRRAVRFKPGKDLQDLPYDPSAK